jgi:hypothetical protein
MNIKSTILTILQLKPQNKILDWLDFLTRHVIFSVKGSPATPSQQVKKSALRLLTYYLLLTDRNLSIRQIFTGLCSLTDDVQKEDFNDWLELGQHAPPARASNPITTGSNILYAVVFVFWRDIWQNFVFCLWLNFLKVSHEILREVKTMWKFSSGLLHFLTFESFTIWLL